MAVKLRNPVEVPATNGATHEVSAPIQIVPLAVSGFLVSRESLVSTLRSLVPGITDIQAFDDGSNFLLFIDPPPAAGEAT